MLTFLIVAVAAWITVIVVHEAGHALVAWVCRMRIVEAHIGSGPIVYTFHFGKNNVPVVIRAVPDSGHVEATVFAADQPKRLFGQTSKAVSFLRRTSLKHALFVAGGPVANLALAAILLHLGGSHAGANPDNALASMLRSVFDLIIDQGSAIKVMVTNGSPNALLQLESIAYLVKVSRHVDGTAVAYWIAFVSAPYGLLNLLPLPGWDGQQLIKNLKEFLFVDLASLQSTPARKI